MNTVSFWRLGHQTAISLCLGSNTASGWCVVVVSTGCWQQHLEHRSSDGASACGATEPCRLARHNLRLTSLVPPVASLHKDSRKLDKVTTAPWIAIATSLECSSSDQQDWSESPLVTQALSLVCLAQICFHTGKNKQTKQKMTNKKPHP